MIYICAKLAMYLWEVSFFDVDIGHGVDISDDVDSGDDVACIIIILFRRRPLRAIPTCILFPLLYRPTPGLTLVLLKMFLDR